MFYELSMRVRNSATSEPLGNVASILSWMLSDVPLGFRCVKIPAIRRPGTAQLKEEDYSGEDLIHRIAKLQNPPHDKQEHKESFQKIESFLQEVTDRPHARLEIPYERDTIIVHMDGRSLPLSSLGTGIHEVIILLPQRPFSAST